jgi:hypothetical protein
MDGCEPAYGCWDLNSGPLEEQSALLTTEPSHQPLGFIFNAFFFLSFCSVEAPSKSTRTSQPQPKQQKKIKAPQDVAMEDLEDKS